MNLNIFRGRMKRIYIISLIAALLVLCGTINSVCSDVSADGSFNPGHWQRYRGTIYDRDHSVIVNLQQGKDSKGNDVIIRCYDNCTPAYSAVIGYRNGYTGRLEGLENSMSEWLLLGNDISRDIGGNIVLTIDSGLQEHCYKQISEFSLGAAVVISIETGEILAMTDVPGYDPSAVFLAQNPEDELALLPNNSLVPFCVRGQIPGSVFKLITASALCDLDMEEFRDNDRDTDEDGGREGRFEYDGHYIQNAGGATFGDVGLAQAIRHSSNIFFAKAVKETAEVKGKEPLKKIFSEKWKLDSSIKLDFVTLNQNYCIDNRHLLYQSAFGQGNLQVSPLYVCMATAAVGDRNGHFCKPYLFKEIEDADGNVIKGKSGKREIITKKAVSKKAREIILEGMKACATDKYKGDVGGHPAAIKTGTAQIGVDSEGNSMVNTWITGLYPADAPKYAVTIASFEIPAQGNWGSGLKDNIAGVFEYLSKMEVE